MGEFSRGCEVGRKRFLFWGSKEVMMVAVDNFV